MEISIETYTLKDVFHGYYHTDTFKILNVLNSSHGVWVIPFLEFLFMYNSVLTNNFDFASLLMNLLVLVFVQFTNIHLLNHSHLENSNFLTLRIENDGGEGDTIKWGQRSKKNVQNSQSKS